MTLLEWATTPIGWFLIGGVFWSIMLIIASSVERITARKAQEKEQEMRTYWKKQQERERQWKERNTS